MKYRYLYLLLTLLLIGCNGGEEQSTWPTGDRVPITITPCTTQIVHEVEGEEITDAKHTRVAPEMIDFPAPGDYSVYRDPVAMFGFFMQDRADAAANEKGCFGETRDDILARYGAGDVSADHAADILQETVDGTTPTREYTQFMNNSTYVFSTHLNPGQPEGGAYISNDIAAFWRPDAYHYLICYAPPVEDIDLVEPLTVALRTEIHGIRNNPDFNFLYGRRVLQYNDSKEDRPGVDPHPYHKNEGVRIYLSPMLARLNLHLKCAEELAGSSVLFGMRVTTYKEAKFQLDLGRWRFDNHEEYQTVTRYYDEDYVIPTEWNPDETEFMLSLFPNIENPGDAIVTEAVNPADNTPVIIRKLEVCVNNTWVEVMNLELRDSTTHTKVGEVIPLAPGYKTDIFLNVKPKAAAGGIDEWNKLIVTFSNWKQDETYEYEGTLE